MAGRDQLTAQLGRLSGLGEGPRRDVYGYVASAGRPVSRDEAATAVGISRPLAAYHLDKLAAAGLLDVSYERRSGRQGPGAGRPSKMYTRAADPVEVSVPARDYEFLAELLASTLEQPDPAKAALAATARRAGAALVRGTAGPASDRDQVLRLLAERGYEPYEDDGTVRFRNCPFHRIAEGHRELVCGANLAFVEGVLDSIPVSGLRARLEPVPGQCCVAIDRLAQ